MKTITISEKEYNNMQKNILELKKNLELLQDSEFIKKLEIAYRYFLQSNKSQKHQDEISIKSTHNDRFMKIPKPIETERLSYALKFVMYNIAKKYINTVLPKLKDGRKTSSKFLFDDDAAMSQPWVANTKGLPRVRVIIDENGAILVYGTRNKNSTTLVCPFSQRKVSRI